MSVWPSSGVFEDCFSWIWKLRNQILESVRVKERTWSMKGFDLRALAKGTLVGCPKVSKNGVLWRNAEDLEEIRHDVKGGLYVYY